MSRTDRLMRLMDALRRLPRPVTAARLAAETGVSARQLYRDIATLRAGGALIDGEAGVGYALTEDPALPPQSFSRLEIEALLLAISSLRSIGDPDLTRAGEEAMARIIATLPDAQGRHAMHATMHLFRPAADLPSPQVDMALLRQALWDEQSVIIDYLDMKQAATSREIWPLGLSYGYMIFKRPMFDVPLKSWARTPLARRTFTGWTWMYFRHVQWAQSSTMRPCNCCEPP